MNIWLLPFPLHKHFEESQAQVLEIAKGANLEIIDSKYANQVDPDKVEKNPPQLTPKGTKTDEAPEEVEKDSDEPEFNPEIHKPEKYQRGPNKGQWKPK